MNFESVVIWKKTYMKALSCCSTGETQENLVETHLG